MVLETWCLGMNDRYMLSRNRECSRYLLQYKTLLSSLLTMSLINFFA